MSFRDALRCLCPLTWTCSSCSFIFSARCVWAEGESEKEEERNEEREVGGECVTLDDQAELVDPRRDIQNQSCSTAPSITHTEVCVQRWAASNPFLHQLKVRLLQRFAAVLGSSVKYSEVGAVGAGSVDHFSLTPSCSCVVLSKRTNY